VVSRGTAQDASNWRSSGGRYSPAGDAGGAPPAANPYAPPAGSGGAAAVVAGLPPSPDIIPEIPATRLGSGGTDAGSGSGNLAPIANPPATRSRVTKGPSALPNDAGQVMRDYDIRPYTSRAAGTAKPEQVIVDWILRETGYEAWHSEPLGLLSANSHTLRVYHTPEMHALVADIVDRFVNRSAAGHAFTLRVVTIDNPNWRSRALPLMTAIPVQSPGVQGWMMPKENAAVVIRELTRRGDYREYNSPQQLIPNGQSILLSTMRPRGYIKGVIPTQNVWPGYQPEPGQLEEGFSMEFSPLLSLDGATAEAVVKLRLQQVEKMLKVKLDVPSPVAQNQRMEIEVPQMTMANLHERFRWPSDQVLLLSMGVIATPGPARGNVVTDALPMLKSAPRADALLMVEMKGSVLPTAATGGTAGTPAAATAARPASSYQGRY
jgi:hypothetical protein